MGKEQGFPHQLVYTLLVFKEVSRQTTYIRITPVFLELSGRFVASNTSAIAVMDRDSIKIELCMHKGGIVGTLLLDFQVN